VLEAESIEIFDDFILLKGFQWNTSKIDLFLKDKPSEVHIKKDLVLAYYAKNNEKNEEGHSSSSSSKSSKSSSSI
jgi:hypothetical protein